MLREERIKNIKRILEVPSYFMQEHRMIARIEEILAEIPGVSFRHDEYGNVFAVKGESETYPLVCAHTDTVHRIQEYELVPVLYRNLEAFRAQNQHKIPCGIGGDNKTGIFICLELLKTQDVLKAAFFVGEEYGCFGSTLASPDFFSNVGYCLEFDAPDFFWVTRRCNGVSLFDPNSEFWQIAEPIMMEQTEGERDPYGNSHPYTDVFPLKTFYDFSCLNYSSGYLRMHTPNEVVVLDYVFTALDTAVKLLQALGTIKYHYSSGQSLNREKLVFEIKEMAQREDWDLVKYPEVLETV